MGGRRMHKRVSRKVGGCVLRQRRQAHVWRRGACPRRCSSSSWRRRRTRIGRRRAARNQARAQGVWVAQRPPPRISENAWGTHSGHAFRARARGTHSEIASRPRGQVSHFENGSNRRFLLCRSSLARPRRPPATGASAKGGCKRCVGGCVLMPRPCRGRWWQR